MKWLQMYLFCRFSIDRHTDLERQFNINADDGKITLATPLDRELSVWHNITIIATEISKCLGLISSLCDWVQFMPSDHMTNGPCLHQIFWHWNLYYCSQGAFEWIVSTRNNLPSGKLPKVAIYMGRKYSHIQIFLYIYYSATK